MSWRLFSTASDAEVPTQSHLLVLLKLVDCCDDDGRNIFPSVATVAKFAKCSSRTVQRVIGEFCRIGLLHRVRDGGQGRGSTAHYEMDIDLLARLRRAELYPALMAAAHADPLPDDEGEQGEGHAPDACGEEEHQADPSHPKGDTVSPLRSDRVTPATAKGDKLCHPTPYRTLKPEREGAQEREASPTIGDAADGHAPDAGDTDQPVPTLVDFRKSWPTTVADDKVRVENAWIALSQTDRRMAIDGIAPFLAHLRKLNRKHIPAGDRYLSQRRWQDIAQSAAASPAAASHVEIAAWSRDWWIVVIDRAMRGEKVGMWVQRADEGKSWGAPAADLEAARRRLGEVRAYLCDGPEIEAWRPWLAARGARIPALRGSFRVFLPGEQPPGRADQGDDDVRF
jgi:hypothetical protein